MAVRVSNRGNWTEIHVPGKVGLRMETKDIPDLINALCAIPQVEELNGTKPLVLYFGNDADRDEFANVVKASFKNARCVKV